MALEVLAADPRVQHALRVGKRMIISRTPLRISFAGGGTDIREYYRNNGGGAVVNAAIDKYVHIVVNKKFDDQVRVSYSSTEIVPSAEDVRHPLVREALKLLDIRKGIEIVSISDIPSHGTGLGSSSTFTVGLLNALHAWVGEHASAKQLAEEAVRIERDIVKDPGGKQDQYIAAYGGLRFMEFHTDERVSVTPIIMTEDHLDKLRKSLLLFYTGKGRPGTPILAGQIDDMPSRLEDYEAIRQLARNLSQDLVNGQVDRLGDCLRASWEIKRRLHEGISDTIIDSLYERARAAGATGGKITGAGGGGFLLLHVPMHRQDSVRKALAELKEQDFHLEIFGSRIVYVGD